MISDETRDQLAALDVDQAKPLLICDVDEVIVHFTSDLESYLQTKDLWLQPSSLSLAGNVRRNSDNTAIPNYAVNALIDDFFADRTRHMQTIPGAVEALHAIGKHASVVMLTNLPHFARKDRLANLADHGLDFPVITNSGPKGPAIFNLAARTTRPVVFVDDSPGFIQSAYEYAPHIHLVHFLQDARFAAHTPHLEFVSLRTDAWTHAKPHILELIAA
jgi:FMN phosphatase YigB (HAD superfamily)